MTAKDRSALLRMAGNVAPGLVIARSLLTIEAVVLLAWGPSALWKVTGALIMVVSYFIPEASSLAVRLALAIHADPRLQVTEPEKGTKG